MILTKFKCKTFLIHIEDIILYSKTVEEHLNHVGEVVTTLTNVRIILKMKKCTFVSDQFEYLRHIIRLGKLQVDEAYKATIKQAKPPTTETYLRSFVGIKTYTYASYQTLVEQKHRQAIYYAKEKTRIIHLK